MSVKDIITELFEKITLDGRGYNKNTAISICTHENADHEDIEVENLFISVYKWFSERFQLQLIELNTHNVVVKTFDEDMVEVEEGINVKDSVIKDLHSALITLNYKDINILCIGDIDIADEERLYHYISRKYQKIDVIILPYHGRVKPFTHGNKGPYDLQKMEERLDKNIRRMGIKVFFMQHFTSIETLPKIKRKIVESRLIPKVHQTLLDVRLGLMDEKS